MPGTIVYVDAFLALVTIFLLTSLRRRRSSPAPPPPGPRGLPLLGNLLQIPTEQEWLTSAKWGEVYGDMTMVSALGQQYIIVNSAKVAVDMLDKKGSIYSDRPVLQMGGELVGWKKSLSLLPYGDRHRNYRRLAHKLFGSHATMKPFHPVEEQETQRFLQRVLVRPDDLPVHIRKTAGAIILRISHGYQIQEDNDPFVSLADQATEQFSLATAPGGFLVNLIPSLRYLPGWVPGGGFKKTAKAWASTLHEMVEQPHKLVKERMASGTADASFTSQLLEDPNISAHEEYDIKWCSASLYSGGADTTVSAIYAFFKAMTLYPEVQKRAQAEIDAVIGIGRLPVLDDRERLPYVNALVFEVLRWHTIGPTGIPHRVTEDDIHEGYFIPKGSVIIPNIWKMAHDPSTYKEPTNFEPARFLREKGNAPEADPRDICFGYGRRICPGKFAQAESWRTVQYSYPAP